ncbi:MAG: hypothetical protein P8J00_07515 [Yoonia sp.]|nr:hypothetical protein [Yoonia sp.]
MNGYFLGGRWNGIVFEPYTPADANTVLRQLRRNGQIPSDSYIVTAANFRQQFWPIGVGAETTAQPLPNATPTPTPTEDVAAADTPVIAEPVAAEPEVDPIAIPDETRAETRASEALLDRTQRKELQTALQWAAFYTAAIDGAYDRGTRAPAHPCKHGKRRTTMNGPAF